MKAVIRILVCFFAFHAGVNGGLFERNTVRGLYQLDDSLNAVHSTNHAPLGTVGFSIGAAPLARYSEEGGDKYLVLNSSTAPNGGLKPTERFLVSPGIAPNGPGGATAVNNWTIVMDVRVPVVTQFTSLVQCQDANMDDAEIFINSSRQIQLFGATNGATFNPVVSQVLAANTWVRLAFTCGYDFFADKNIIRVYVNGVETGQSSPGNISADKNGRFGLTPQFALFSDENNETAVTHLGSLGVWGRSLPSSDISVMGSYLATGITWAGITPANGTPPLPLLTGNLYFGDFLTRYTPPTGAALVTLANSARSPTNSSYVCEVTLPLSTFGGTVPGFPKHRFGGSFDVGILPNGDTVSLQTRTLIYLPGTGDPAADIGNSANVSFVRTNLSLTTSGLTGAVKLYFPAGMSVAMDDTSRRSIDRTKPYGVGLDQNMVPKNDLVITKTDFEGQSENGTIYPCTERIPVRFAAASITWARLTGRFTFSQTATVISHQETQINFLTSRSPEVRGKEVPASNDLYFLAARNVTGSVIFGARAGGIATNEQVVISLDPGKFGQTSIGFATHYPLMSVTWSGAGSIDYFANQITSASNLPNAATGFLTYRRNLPIADCKGLSQEGSANVDTVYFVPAGRVWRFSQDGGLKASGIVGFARDAGTDLPTGSFIPRWVGYFEGGLNRYGHQITTGFTSGRVEVAGQACVGSEISGLTLQQKPYGILYSGHGSPANEALVERPGTDGYAAGNADYPGLNLRATPGTFNAVSRIAGATTPSYPLASSAKYYLRRGGVSGVHASASSSPISLSAYGGAAFNLSSLQLSYVDGVNRDSGVNGNVTVPTPNSTSFALNMKRVLFGPQGQIAEAKLLTPQPAINLSYWNFSFLPLGIDFPQPKGCPPPSPSEGFVRISAVATMPAMVAAGKTVTGMLGFSGGDLVTQGQAVAADYPGISRFDPGGLLGVPGPDGKTWNVVCTSGIYLNNKSVSGPDAGSINAGGLMDVPFFNDMPVHLRASSAPGGANPLVHVRTELSPQATTAGYDLTHVGKPNSSVALADYLNPAIQGYNPVAERKWQDLVTFKYPVAYQTGSRTFRSVAPVESGVLLFTLNQGVKDMSPDNADLVFDGGASLSISNLVDQVNFGKVINGVLTGPISGLAGPARDAVKRLDNAVPDDPRELLKPALALIGTKYGSVTFFNTLKNPATDRAAAINGLLNSISTDVRFIHSSTGSGINGQANRTITAELDAAISGFAAGKNLVTNAANIGLLADFLRGSGGAKDVPDAKRLAELASVFDRVGMDLVAARDGIAAPLDAAINRAGAGQPLVNTAIQLALSDLLDKWATSNVGQANAVYASGTAAEFATDLTNALADRLGGSSYSIEAGTILRQQLEDVRFLSRQVLDDTAALAASLIPSIGSATRRAASGQGINDKLASVGLKGYAHIKGDTMAELRLDGEAELNVGDEMKFTAFFLLKTVDSNTPGGACLAAGGAKAEVTIGASTDLSWTGQDAEISLQGKVAFDGTGSPVGIYGDLKLVGQLDFSEVSINELALGFGFGIDSAQAVPGNRKQYYLYGKAVGKVAAMDVAAGIFIGRTCMIDPIMNADPDIGRVVASQNLQPPYTGAAVYAYGAISLMPIIGIPPSCLLDLRVGGGQGFFAFSSGADGGGPLVVGFKSTQSVSGELLCLASVKGQQDTVIAGVGTISGGSPHLESVTGDSRFTLSGKVGVGFVSYTFKKSVGLIITAAPLKTRIDY